MKKTRHTILSLCLVLTLVLPAGTVYADSHGPQNGFGTQAQLQQLMIEQFSKGTCSLAELIGQLRALYGGAGHQTPDPGIPGQDAENNTENNVGNDTENNTN